MTERAEWPEGTRMGLFRGAAGVAISFAIVAVVTAALWLAKLAGFGPLHPVFFYLLPIALVAVLYGSVPALLCAATAIACSAYFLYDPIYSFYVTKPLEYGDLICFAMLAFIGVKCTVDLVRPAVKISVADGPQSVA
jgi:K+-sensing histidine kinase KdpD